MRIISYFLASINSRSFYLYTMKKILTIILVFTANLLFAQVGKSGDEILGIWKTGTGNGKVEIFKKGDQYLGKIVWMSEPIDPTTKKPKTDTQHPDKSLHSRPVMGLTNLWGFAFKGNNKWEEGHIYDPKNGKEYKCNISCKDKNTLNVRGYIGIAALGRTEVWTRSSL
jgi:uncharacterized protein (DUF2147 family)